MEMFVCFQQSTFTQAEENSGYRTFFVNLFIFIFLRFSRTAFICEQNKRDSSKKKIYHVNSSESVNFHIIYVRAI